EQERRRSELEILNGPQLELDNPWLRDRRVGAVERTVGEGVLAPGDGRHQQQDPAKGSPAVHGLGRKTQIAAGSAPVARTARYNRSVAGTNNDVRAPLIVGMPAMCS